MVDAPTEPVAEEPPPAADPGLKSLEAWKARDRKAELAELAADPKAVAAMKRRLTSLGIASAVNPFDGSDGLQAAAAASPTPSPAYDWKRFLPKGLKL